MKPRFSQFNAAGMVSSAMSMPSKRIVRGFTVYQDRPWLISRADEQAYAHFGVAARRFRLTQIRRCCKPPEGRSRMIFVSDKPLRLAPRTCSVQITSFVRSGRTSVPKNARPRNFRRRLSPSPSTKQRLTSGLFQISSFTQHSLTEWYANVTRPPIFRLQMIQEERGCRYPVPEPVNITRKHPRGNP